MSKFIVLTRFNKNHVTALEDSVSRYEQRIAIFKSEDDAIEVAEDNPLCCAMGYQIVELEI